VKADLGVFLFDLVDPPELRKKKA